jgi:hypothetical protein
MKLSFLIYVIFSISVFSCKGQSVDDEIKGTSREILNAISTGDEKKFKEKIGVNLMQIGKNEELLHFDFENLKSYYGEYLKNINPNIIITDQYNEVGSLKVIIPFFKTADSSKRIQSIQLELFFGPPNFVPLNKISKYNILVERKIDMSTTPLQKNN